MSVLLILARDNSVLHLLLSASIVKRSATTRVAHIFVWRHVTYIAAGLFALTPGIPKTR